MVPSSSWDSDLFPRDILPLVSRICPRCRRADRVESHVTLCRKCGETLEPRGFCPICESFVNQPLGEYCDKHDVPLEEEAGTPSAAELSSKKWVTIGTYPDRSAVEGLRIRLESEGIPTFLDGERMGSAAMYQVATGGVKLQVPEELADEARILVSQVWSPPGDDPDELDEAWDDLAPSPGVGLHTAIELMFYLIAGAMGLLAVGALMASLLGRLTH